MKNPRPASNRKDEPAFQGIWSGTISFSLVAIPVQLVSAVRTGRVSFRMLHSKDYSPLSREMSCPEEEKIVPPDEIIRGYEIGPDNYIVVTDKELESLSPERSRTIEILEFIDLKEVDLIYYDHPYYLVPSKGGEKAYRLLVDVLHQTNKAGLAKFVLRDREYPVVIKSIEGALALITLHYSEEILSDEDIAPKKEEIGSDEKSRVKQAIKKMVADFDPEKYADGRQKKILDLLKKKTKEKAQVEAPEIVEEGETHVDLVAALQESMRKIKRNR